MGRAKIIFGDQVLQDLTRDTITPEVLMEGYTAHAANGEKIVGTNDYEKKMVHWGDQSKGYVGKNLFKNTGLSTTSNNVVFTHNSDDSIGLNNTASATTFYTIGSVASLAGINQNVILSGCPAGGDTNNGYSMGIRTKSNKNVRHDNIDIVDTGNGFIFNPSNPLKDSDGNSVSISDLVLVMRIGNGVNVSDKTFYPMIRLASIPDSTYEPYLTPNTEIDNKVSNKTNGDLGAKNFLPFPYESTSKTDAGVTFTVQSDGGIKIEGETTDTGTELRLMGRLATDSYKMLLNTGQYILSNNFDLTSTGIEIALGGTKNNAYVAVGSELRYSKEVKIFVTNDSVDQIVDDKYVIAVYIRLAPHKTYDTVVYPMVRYADDNDNTYHKYAMTNSELTKEIKHRAGDTIELSTMYGYVTSGTSQLYCNISGKFDTKTISSVQITGTDVRARGTKGYIKDNNGVSLEGVNFADYLKVDHFDKYNDQLLISIVTKTNGTFQNVDNNTPITITSAKFTITLS